MIFFNTPQSREKIPMMMELDKKVYGEGLLYHPSPQVFERVRHPMNILSSALTPDGGVMLGYFAMVVVGESYYQRLLSGQAKEEEAEPWDHRDTPLLFIRDLVTRDRRATPYLFRHALKDLHGLCEEHDIYIHRAFTIAYHWTMKRVLKNYQFEETGRYQKRYSIMMASRDKSVVFNSFMKRY